MPWSERAQADQERAEILSDRRARRAELLARRMTLPQDEHRRLGAAVVGGLISAFPAIRSERVGIYWPHRREISPFSFASRVLAEGGEISLPLVLVRRRPMQFRTWKPGDPLSVGVYGIPFPRDGAAVRPAA